jgi:hypothetical protein
VQGAYFFVDFDTGRLMTLRMVGGVAEDAIEHTSQIVGTDLRLEPRPSARQCRQSLCGEPDRGDLPARSGSAAAMGPTPSMAERATTFSSAARAMTHWSGIRRGFAQRRRGLDRASYAGAGPGLIARLDTAPL